MDCLPVFRQAIFTKNALGPKSKFSGGSEYGQSETQS